MAAISVTADQVASADPCCSCIKSFIAAAAITKGQSLYVDTNGKVNLCDANASGAEQFIGIALTKAAAGQAVDVQMSGPIAGFTLTSVAYGGVVYQGDTAGELATTASSTKTIIVGRCLPSSDSSLTKLLYIDLNTTVW